MREHLTSLGDAFPGVTLGWVEHGDPSASRTVLCVHGLTRNARDFDVLGAHLAERGARVISVDVVGRGRSSWLADPQGYALPVYALQLQAFLQVIGVERADWVGTSMGGLIGMIVAAQERPPIDRLVLNDVGPFVPQAALLQIKTYLGLDLVFPTLEAVEAHLRLIHAGFGRLTDAQWQAMARTSARRDPDGFRLSYDPAIRVPYDTLADADVDLWELWDGIAVPSFLLRGQHSTLLPADIALAMTRRGPRAALETAPDAGHAPALMNPSQLAIVAGWLDL